MGADSPDITLCLCVSTDTGFTQGLRLPGLLRSLHAAGLNSATYLPLHVLLCAYTFGITL